VEVFSVPEADSNLNDTINFALSFVVRRRWWISLTASSVALATIVVALGLPNRYTSQATLVVVQQQVSQRFVEPGTSTTAADAIQAMTRELLSRGQLLRIIEDFGLYSDMRQHQTPEVLAERMRNDIVIDPLDQIGRSDFGAFRITFTAASPHLAQAITGRLTSLFIETNLKSRGDSAARTTSFLSEQLEAARKKLAEQEQRLQDFKMHNSGELPEQQQATLGALTGLQIQLQSTTAGLSRAQQQRKSLEASVGAAIRGSLAGLQSERAALLIRYTPLHSEVIKKDQEIARWQDFLEHWRTGGQLTTTLLDNPAIASLRSQVDANAAEIEQLSKDQQTLTAQIEQSQKRLNIAPIREQQLAGMLREYELYKSEYEDLQNKRLQSQLTTNLEEKQEGQQFRLVDPPTVPVVPSSPARVKICLGGLAGGLFLGLALAFLIDTRNHCFHLEKELSQSFKLPLVVGIPLLLTPAEERARTWKRAFEWLAATSMAVGVFAAELYIYRIS
jgi:succinoglycan biosynthesis transport protein ExoP